VHWESLHSQINETPAQWDINIKNKQLMKYDYYMQQPCFYGPNHTNWYFVIVKITQGILSSKSSSSSNVRVKKEAVHLKVLWLLGPLAVQHLQHPKDWLPSGC
jgi:hypothetical protein